MHLEFAFAGGRMLRDLLVAEGFTVGALHVSMLMKPMKRMSIEALCRCGHHAWNNSICSPRELSTSP